MAYLAWESLWLTARRTEQMYTIVTHEGKIIEIPFLKGVVLALVITKSPWKRI